MTDIDIWPSCTIHRSRNDYLSSGQVVAIDDILHGIAGRIYTDGPYLLRKGCTVVALAKFGTDSIGGNQLLIRIAVNDQGGRCTDLDYCVDCADLEITVFAYGKSSGLGNNDEPIGPNAARERLEEVAKRIKQILQYPPDL